MISLLASLVLGVNNVLPPIEPVASNIVISRLQVSYGSDGRQEFVEIYNNGESRATLDNWKLEYQNDTTRRTLYEFNNVELEAHESFLVAYEYTVKSSGVTYSYYADQRNGIFTDPGATGSLAAKEGIVTLTDGNTSVVDQVNYGEVNTAKMPTIGRCAVGGGEILQDTNRDNDDFYQYLDDSLEGYVECSTTFEPEEPINACSGLVINELSLVEGKGFVEIVNETNESLMLDGCLFHRGTIEVGLSGVLGTGKLKSFVIDNDVGLKSMNSTIDVYLYDLDFPKEKISLVNYKAVKVDAAWAWFDTEEFTGWRQTFAPTPGAENEYQQYQTCEAGKMINPETGNCIKMSTTLTECPTGQYRNPETGRCRKIATATTLAACPEGSFRNPETNRCKKLASETVLAACQTGYERNPETNRCRKIVDSSSPTFAVQNTPTSTETNIMIGVAAGCIGVTLAMIVWSFRQEIGRGFRKIFRRKAMK
jgi:hypothetical protein